MNKKTSVTIGIPAYNEETNIGNMLKSLLNQEQTGYKMDQIIVLGDGCTDKTEEIVRDLAKKHDVITLLFDGQRLGKQERVNRLFKKLESDVVILIDADVILASKHTISNLISYFNSNTGVVSGNDQPVDPPTFLGKVFSSIDRIWYQARKSSNQGINIHNQRGRMFAVSKEFAKTLNIPKNAIDDYYVFLDCIKRGFKFEFAERAVVYYNPPSTMSDHKAQNIRGVEMADNALTYFSEDLKKSAFCVTLKDKLRGILNEFRHDPIFTVFALFFVFLYKVYTRNYEPEIEGAWESIKTTKKKVKPTPAKSGRI